MLLKTLNIGSWNIRGMGDPTKKAAVFSVMEAYGAELVCLQETHLTNETKLQVRCNKFQEQYHSVHSSYSRGVATSITIGTTIWICHSPSVKEGRQWYRHRCRLHYRHTGTSSVPPHSPAIAYRHKVHHQYCNQYHHTGLPISTAMSQRVYTPEDAYAILTMSDDESSGDLPLSNSGLEYEPVEDSGLESESEEETVPPKRIRRSGPRSEDLPTTNSSRPQEEEPSTSTGSTRPT
ncbi:hypothetical protein AB205_0131840 [Aquarana catesbeiana]|uniref:Endonuclease/exonuclease/phosphatase domain-containing protein n=1 Tax=Aquarana catesbeiana TaxID=8400 RepID=A0A2G9S458_AQUCT|nr:hypothetical protein AB205_0131840 [Aquarana catesbeiana]